MRQAVSNRDDDVLSKTFVQKPRSCPRWVIAIVAVITLIISIDICAIAPIAVYSVYDYGGSASVSGVSYLGRTLILMLVYVVMLRWIVVQAMAFYEHDRLARNRGSLPVSPPFVSVLVPAFNESATIGAALASLIALEYPHYEVICVDDGSTDDTFSIARSLAGDHGHCNLSVFSKANGGKWTALNYAYAEASADYILCVDADSGLAANALTMLIARMTDPRIACVAGQVTIRNRGSLLARFQAAEYILSNGGIRMALSAVGLVTVVPGQLGSTDAECWSVSLAYGRRYQRQESISQSQDRWVPCLGRLLQRIFNSHFRLLCWVGALFTSHVPWRILNALIALLA